MPRNALPFNVEIIKLDQERLRSTKPVSSLDIYDRVTGNFHEEGLFSVSIFGRVGDDSRSTKFSYVDTKISVFHPLVYKALTRLKGFYKDLLDGRAYAIWDPQLKDFVPSNELVGRTGFAFFLEHWNNIAFKETNSAVRTQRIKLIKKYRDRALTNKILILPAALRDLEVDEAGRETQDEINDLYRRIVAISRTVPNTDDVATTPMLDNSRRSLQMVFNELYALIERMITGKKGFIQGKFSSRRIFNGTRNVISSMDTSPSNIDAPNYPQFNTTAMGIFQVAKGILPLTVGSLKRGWLSTIFGQGGSGTTATLVDPKTLTPVAVDLPLDERDRWVTVEGLEKVIESLRVAENRLKPIKVGGCYLGLVYLGPDKTFRVFNDIRELPKEFSRQHVRPISLIELIYLSGLDIWNKSKCIVTRYPVNGLGSTYPSHVYIKTTVVSDLRTELDEQWQVAPNARLALEYPISESAGYVDTEIIHPSQVAGLNADYDGDTCSAIFIYSDEGIAEINRYLSTREAYVDTAGRMLASMSIMTVNQVMYNLTGD